MFLRQTNVIFSRVVRTRQTPLYKISFRIYADHERRNCKNILDETVWKYYLEMKLGERSRLTDIVIKTVACIRRTSYDFLNSNCSRWTRRSVVPRFLCLEVSISRTGYTMTDTYLDGREHVLVGILVGQLSAQGCHYLVFCFRVGSLGHQRQDHRSGKRGRHVIETVTGGRGLHRKTQRKQPFTCEIRIANLSLSADFCIYMNLHLPNCTERVLSKNFSNGYHPLTLVGRLAKQKQLSQLIESYLIFH